MNVKEQNVPLFVIGSFLTSRPEKKKKKENPSDEGEGGNQLV